MHRPLLLKTLVCLVVLAMLASAFNPHDRTTWLMEILPAAILLPVLVSTHQRFPLSSLLYLLLAIQALGLIAGGHYSFARVPVGPGSRTGWSSVATPMTASGTSFKASCRR